VISAGAERFIDAIRGRRVRVFRRDWGQLRWGQLR
jgi:hypothetical protein